MKKRLLKIIMRDVLLFLILLSYYLLNKYVGFSIPCPFHLITGYLCPGCGITRALFALLEFKFHEAITYNLLVVFYTPLFILYFGYLDYLFIFDKKDKIIKKIPNIIWYILIIITILFGIVRNII